MKLNRYKIGELIEQRREKYNGIENLPVRGVTREGFIPPKQKLADTSIYNVFYRNDFVFNPARMELNSIALNVDIEKGICSSLYEVFYVKREDLVLPKYLNIFIKRDEFARRCWFNAIGSARNYFRVSDLSELEIDIPSIEVQRKFVSIYDSIVTTLKSCNAGLDELKLVCDGFIEDLRKKYVCEPLSSFARVVDNRNADLQYDNVFGLTVYKKFIETKADLNGVPLHTYKIVKKGNIAYVPTTNRNGDRIACGLCEEDCIVSQIYEILELDTSKVDPRYVFMWFERSEMDRFARYNSWGSARETISWEDLGSYLIPLPPIEIQKNISQINKCVSVKKKNSEIIVSLLSNICSLLYIGSTYYLEEEA